MLTTRITAALFLSAIISGANAGPFLELGLGVNLTEYRNPGETDLIDDKNPVGNVRAGWAFKLYQKGEHRILLQAFYNHDSAAFSGNDSGYDSAMISFRLE